MNDDLAEAHVKLEAAREAIRSTPELASLAEKLARMAAEVRRIEAKVAAHMPLLR